MPVELGATQLTAYSYLLGMYRGDGYLSRTPRTYLLEISLHEQQTRVIDRVMRAPDRPGALAAKHRGEASHSVSPGVH